jgi:LDH2 family malate/lactate/ureidoglycolate dehydrogenase
VNWLRNEQREEGSPGFAEVLVPGDLKRRTRATREREGIPIPDDLWQELIALAGPAGAV